MWANPQIVVASPLTTYQKLSVTFEATASGVARIHLFGGGAAGVVQWDDVQISPL